MAIPTHYLNKRGILYGPKTPLDTLIRVGNEFLESELYSDALDFFERAQHDEGVQRIKAHALKTGDTFLLSRLERFDAKLVAPEDWETAKEVAMKSGRASMSRFADKKLHPEASEQESLPGVDPLKEA